MGKIYENCLVYFTSLIECCIVNSFLLSMLISILRGSLDEHALFEKIWKGRYRVRTNYYEKFTDVIHKYDLAGLMVPKKSGATNPCAFLSRFLMGPDTDLVFEFRYLAILYFNFVKADMAAHGMLFILFSTSYARILCCTHVTSRIFFCSGVENSLIFS